MNTDINKALEPLIKAFEELGVAYYIGGSLASSVYGIARATMDIDLISELRQNQVSFLFEKLKSKYFIDENMILDAIKNNSSFNIIHLDTMLKIDVFIPKAGFFNKKVFERRQKDLLSDEPGSIEIYLCSSEDTILSKLEWYKLGGCISEHQWKDIIGVIKVQGELLDKNYLSQWAEELGVADLLEKALSEGKI